MGYFYTDQLLTRLNAGADMNNRVLKMTLFSRAPQIDFNDGRTSLHGVTTLASLLAMDGWEEVSAANYARQTTTVPLISTGNNRYVKLNTSLVPFPASMDPTDVEAVVFSVNGTDIGLPAGDYVLFGTTTPFGAHTVFQGGDGISARVDTTIGQRWLFGWAISGGIVSSVSEGTTVIQQGAPPYEVSHVNHAWLLPQRINYIANPSFEAGVTHWQTNTGVMTRSVAANDFPSHYIGHALGPAPAAVLPQFDPASRLYLKSNVFYPRSQDFTFQIMARGTGVVRVAVAYYPRDYSEYAADWGLKDTLVFEEWTLDPTTYMQLRGVRSTSDAYEVALLLEVRASVQPEIYIDLGLIEEGVLLDWQYFDGDSDYGALEDFSWYGNEVPAVKRGASFSMWYNNRRSIGGRLFGRRLDDTAYYTSADEQLDSLVSQWIPAGSVVVPHWDVLGTNDLQAIPVDRSATTLPVQMWPEVVQPFRITDVVDTTATSADFHVVGEGAFPIVGGFLLSGTTTYPLTILPRTYDPADLYDQSKPQLISVTWPSVPAFQAHKLYLARGSTTGTPLSFVTMTNLNAAGSALFAVGAGAAQNAQVQISAPAGAIASTGQAFNLTTGAATVAPAQAAAATGVGNDSGTTVRFVGAVTATGFGFGIDAVDDGYLLLPGTAGNAITFSRSALGSVTSVEFALRVYLDAVGVAQALAGWSGGGGGLSLTAANKLNCGVTKTGGGLVGGADSTIAVPSLAVNTKVWLRGIVTASTGVCDYYYSYTNTNDYDAVVWTVIGAPIAGASGAVDLTKTTTPIYGAVTLTVAGYAGRLYAGAEAINGTKTIEFDATDFPP